MNRHLIPILLAFILWGCSGPPATPSKMPSAMTTVAPITDLVQQVGAGSIEAWGIIPEGVDSHTFEPSPRDVARIRGSSVIFVNGLGLELPTMRLVRSNKAPTAEVVALGDRSIQRSDWLYDRDFPAGGGTPNPHIWTNPPYALRYVALIRDELSKVFPSAAGRFRKNAESLTSKIAALDAAIRVATASVPPGQRRLLTYHDSLPYFAREYGWTVIGAIQPSDFSEPSAQDVARLIDQIRRENIRAIFGSEVFPSSVLEQIARDSGARYVDELRDDDLPGRPGEPDHTYIGMMKHNVITIVRALGGDPSPLESVDARAVE